MNVIGIISFEVSLKDNIPLLLEDGTSVLEQLFA